MLEYEPRRRLQRLTALENTLLIVIVGAIAVVIGGGILLWGILK